MLMIILYSWSDAADGAAFVRSFVREQTAQAATSYYSCNLSWVLYCNAMQCNADPTRRVHGVASHRVASRAFIPERRLMFALFVVHHLVIARFVTGEDEWNKIFLIRFNSFSYSFIHRDPSTLAWKIIPWNGMKWSAWNGVQCNAICTVS